MSIFAHPDLRQQFTRRIRAAGTSATLLAGVAIGYYPAREAIAFGFRTETWPDRAVKPVDFWLSGMLEKYFDLISGGAPWAADWAGTALPFMLLCGAAMAPFLISFQQQPDGRVMGGRLGNARWQSPAETARMVVPNNSSTAYFEFGRCRKTRRLLGAKLRAHIMLIAQTRKGKGTSVIINNIVSAIGSTIVYDPKGENWFITRSALLAKGHRVHAIDPFNITAEPSASINFLDFLSLDDPIQIQILVDTLMSSSPNADAGPNEAFRKGGRNLLVAAVAVVLEGPSEDKHLGRVRDLVNDLDQLRKLLEQASPKARNIGLDALSMLQDHDPRFRENCKSNAQNPLSFLIEGKMMDVLKTSSFDPSEVCRAESDIFLIIPDHMTKVLSAFIRMFVTLFLKVTRDQQPTKRILFFLDEASTLGGVEELKHAQTIAAGRGISFVWIFQSLNQIAENFGEHAAKTIRSACEFTITFGFDSVTDQTIEFSKSLGNYTAWIDSDGKHHDFWGKMTGSNAGRSQQAVALASPDLLASMPGDEAVLQCNSDDYPKHPLIISKNYYYNDDRFANLVGPNPYYKG